MSGRLGNQMFQYAFARGIQTHFTGELLIDFSRQAATAKALKKLERDDSGWSDQLAFFKTKYDSIISKRNTRTSRLLARIEYLAFPQKILYLTHYFVLKKLLKKFLRARYEDLPFVWKIYSDMLSKCGLYIFPILTGPKIKENKFSNFLLESGFEDSEIFEKMDNNIFQEFAPKFPLNPENERFLQLISSKNSICVTIRRGDYLSNEAFSSFFQTDDTYFTKGVQYICEKIENPYFIFFSDDLEYAKKFAENLHLSKGNYSVEREGNSVAEKVKLMSSCKHFIISNSTFSWWCQFLSQNENKIVVAPEYWYPNIKKHMPIEQKKWIKIAKTKGESCVQDR